MAVELTNVSPNGFWLLVDGQEPFIAFAAFPWFRDATIRQLARIERPSPHHLRWPDLDVDLAVDSLIHPDRYPLITRLNSSVREARTVPKPRAKRSSRAKRDRKR